jgi:hypothetical protein
MDNAHPSPSDSPTASPESAPSVETIAPGITLEWLCDGRIPAFTMKTSARASIDAWIEKLKEVGKEWPAGQPFLSLQDISDKNVGATPYFRARIEEMPTWRPQQVEAHVALIVPRSIQGRLFQMFLQARKGEPVRIFFSREDGLAWLVKRLEAGQPGKDAADSGHEPAAPPG